jgi:dipeptidyl aminopeptidase/acylaminoacyl peptidase
MSSCKQECLVEEKEYSCEEFNINDVIYEDNITLLSEIEYISEGLKIKGILAEPKGIGEYSLIMFNHGGKGGIEELNWLKELTANDYVVLASQYRGEGGSEGNIEVALGETTDVLNLLECGKNFNKVDVNRIGIIGLSHGGGITIQAMSISDDFKAGVEFWGAIDVYKRFKNIRSEDDPIYHWTESVEQPGSKLKLREELLKRSAIHCVDKIKVPLLVFQGKIDELMPYSYALDFINVLEKEEKEYEFVVYDGIGHEFEKEDGSKDLEIEAEAMVKVVDWFDKYLK